MGRDTFGALTFVMPVYLQSVFSALFIRGQQWCSLWLPVYCSNLFLSTNVILLQVVCDFLTVGSYCRAIPYSPQVPSGNSIESMIAFPQEPNKKSKIHFFLASNEQDFKYVSTGFFVACGI